MLNMDWEPQVLLVGRTLFAALLGALVGWEREKHGTDAGLRTHIAVAIGASTFTLISMHIPGADPSRIASQVVIGMGFLGAGIIIRQDGKTYGLTTAAALWATAAAAMAVAYGMYVLAVLTALIIYATLALHHFRDAHRLSAAKSSAHDTVD